MAATKTTRAESPEGPNDFRPLVMERVQALFGLSRVVEIPKRGGSFETRLVEEGLDVANLGKNDRLLEWDALYEAVHAVIKHGDRTPKGNAMNSRLGDRDLPFNSIEGWVAHTVYGKTAGQTVFRRITPLVRILQAAGVFKPGEGPVSLTSELKSELDALQENSPQREEDFEATI